MKTYAPLYLAPGPGINALALTSGAHIVAEVHARTYPPDEREAVALDHAERLRSTWNSCVGLTLPDDVPPGILCDLVATLRDFVAATDRQPFGDPRADGSGVVCGSKLHTEARELLARLDAVPPGGRDAAVKAQPAAGLPDHMCPAPVPQASDYPAHGGGWAPQG